MYMSPEVLWPERFGYKNARPTKESDVYSLGMVIYEVHIPVLVPFPYLRYKANRSFAGIDLFQTWANGPPWGSY